MSDFPQPLVPYDCDLRDFPFMPLDVLRLRDSDFAAVTNGEEFRAGLMLWCAAWHQVPSGSIPDDDIILAKLAGYGRVVSEWQKVREGALHGWIKCSDGRLYHSVISEKALDAWESKQQHAYKKYTERLRKENKNRKEQGLELVEVLEFQRWLQGKESISKGRKNISSGKNEFSNGKYDQFQNENDSFHSKTTNIPEEVKNFPADNFGTNDDSNEKNNNFHDEKAFQSNGNGNPDISDGKNEFSSGKNTVSENINKNSSEIPAENALIGIGIGRRIDNIIVDDDIAVSENLEIPAESLGGSKNPIQERALEIALMLRKQGANLVHSNPHVLEWAENGVTDAQLLTALEAAQKQRYETGSAQPINAGYLNAIIANLINQKQSGKSPSCHDLPKQGAGEYGETRLAPSLQQLTGEFSHDEVI